MTPKWDYYKVRRSESRRLTRSTKSKDGYRGLIHGKRGVSQQAELFKVNRREATRSGGATSAFRAILGFVGKSVLVLGAIGAALMLAGWILSTAFTAAGTGLEQLNAWLAANSLLVAIVVNVSVWTAIALVAAKVARFVGLWREDRRERLERTERQTTAMANAAAAKAEATRIRQLASVPVVFPDWYPDPTDPTQIRYWDGHAWTTRVRPLQVLSTTPADWYPDPTDTTQFRYWDGAAWTPNVVPMSGGALTVLPAQAAPIVTSSECANAQPRVAMTSLEWQQQFLAWMAVAAVEQELWARLANAQISDADQRTLQAQAQLRKLTPEQGAQRIRLALEANPGLREGLRVDELLAYMLAAPEALTVNRGRKSVGQVRDPLDRR